MPFKRPSSTFPIHGRLASHEVRVVTHTLSHSSPSTTPRVGSVVLFDATHGQANWAQTGYPSREMHTNFAGMVHCLCRLGCTCATTYEKPLSKSLSRAKLLVVPPPAGHYQARQQCWLSEPASLFTAEEIQDILGFLRDGGRLLAFAYRFGDSFTHTNLHDLFGPLGCLLNDDAIIDITTLRTTPALQTGFETPADLLPLAWFRPGVERVRWRSTATFTLLPGAIAQPLALSPGGRCIAFDRTHRRIRFDSRPIAVAGLHHEGRFVLLGGPHVFETGPFGLLGEADNARFMENLLQWLLEDDPAGLEPLRLMLAQPMRWQSSGLLFKGMELGGVESHGSREEAIASVERLLRKTGVLKALARPQWQP